MSTVSYFNSQEWCRVLTLITQARKHHQLLFHARMEIAIAYKPYSHSTPDANRYSSTPTLPARPANTPLDSRKKEIPTRQITQHSKSSYSIVYITPYLMAELQLLPYGRLKLHPKNKLASAIDCTSVDPRVPSTLSHITRKHRTERNTLSENTTAIHRTKCQKVRDGKVT